MARLMHTSGGIVPQKRNSATRQGEDGYLPGGGAAAAPIILQGRNSVASINSGYNEPNTNQRSQPRGAGGA